MRIAVCDDDKQERSEIISGINAWDPTRPIEEFSDGRTFLRACVERPYYSIVFLDIYFPNENGINIAKQLKEISPLTEIVFITTSLGHAVDAYSINALHYLVKPVSAEGIRECFERLSQKQSPNKKTLPFRRQNTTILILLDDIRSIQSKGHKIVVFTKDGKSEEFTETFSGIENRLDDRFLTLRRGFSVNMDSISKMLPDAAVLTDGEEVLLSRRECARIKEKFENYIFGKLSANINGEVR